MFECIQSRLEQFGPMTWLRLTAAATSLLLALIASDCALGLRHLFWTQLGLSVCKPFIRLYYLDVHGVDISPHKGVLSRALVRIIAYRQRRYQ